MAIKSQFPALKPTADFNFAATKTLDPRITFSRASPATYYDGKTLAKAEENLLLNSATMVAQSLYVYDKVYTLSFEGTGSVVLSGAHSATLAGTGVSNRVGLTFTPTKAALTLTPSGTVTNAQLEQRDFAGPYTPTTTATITYWQPVLLTAAAGVPRFQHDPVTGKSLGLLPEKQSSNILLWSEFGGADLYSGSTSYGGGVAEAKMFAPSGTLVRAARFNHSPATPSYLYKGTVAASTTYAFSCHIKMDDGSAPTTGGNTGSGDFSIVISGAIVATSSTRVVHVGGGLYRVDAVAVSGTNNLGDNGVIKYTTQSSKGFRTTGWQLEAQGLATSYIKTEGSQVTRYSDSAVIDGVNFDSFYNQRGGTFVVDCLLSVRSAGANIALSLSHNSTVGDRMNVYNSSTSSINVDNFVSGVSSGSVALSNTVVNGQRHVIARRCADYALAACVNGGSVAASASGILGPKNTMGIGSSAYSSLDRADHPIARIAYYDELLTDAQMQALTKV